MPECHVYSVSGSMSQSNHPKKHDTTVVIINRVIMEVYSFNSLLFLYQSIISNIATAISIIFHNVFSRVIFKNG